jgi:hypothetical protein
MDAGKHPEEIIRANGQRIENKLAVGKEFKRIGVFVIRIIMSVQQSQQDTRDAFQQKERRHDPLRQKTNPGKSRLPNEKEKKHRIGNDQYYLHHRAGILKGIFSKIENKN